MQVVLSFVPAFKADLTSCSAKSLISLDFDLAHKFISSIKLSY